MTIRRGSTQKSTIFRLYVYKSVEISPLTVFSWFGDKKKTKYCPFDILDIIGGGKKISACLVVLNCKFDVNKKVLGNKFGWLRSMS